MKQFIFIMTDTQRKDMLGCYGNKDLKTPFLDALAGAGIRFENSYTCTPVCGPARSALFTGIFPHSNGSWANSMAIGDNVKTIGQRLRDNGIHAGYIGKWHVDGGDYFGLARCPDGWDPRYWYDMRCYLEELTPEERVLSRKMEANHDPGIAAEFTFAHRCANRAIAFLEENKERDFFLTVSLDEPHGPYLCPKPFSEMYTDYQFPKSPNLQDDLSDKPEHQQLWSGDLRHSDKEALEIQAPDFFGCNSFADHEIGRVLAAADQFAPRALTMYTSDHGDMLYSHSLAGSGKGPAMYEEITNVPFLVKWPGNAPTGTVCDYLVSHIDVVPTVLDFFGLPLPKLLEGRSLLPLFSSDPRPVNDHIFIEFGRYEVDHDGFGGFQPIRSCFDGRHKLVINLLSTDEFYDLENDPGEMRNLIEDAGSAPARDCLHDELIDWMNRTRDPFRGYYWQSRPWRKDAPPRSWKFTSMTRQRENEEYEPRQLDYDTGLEMEKAVRIKS